jgi:hypothetical protein
MRPESEYARVRELLRKGLNDCAIARNTGIPRTTVREWRIEGDVRRAFKTLAVQSTCPTCAHHELDGSSYAYLLGLYLGDGWLSIHRRGVFRLRVALDRRYPGIIDECASAIGAVSRRVVGRVSAPGCVVVNAYWKHWPCVFPQHARGRKHDRDIALAAWQQEIALRRPDRLLRGLIHSDGCRFLNHVNGTDYPRYQFRNKSDGIRMIFKEACTSFGVRWTQPRVDVLSVARRGDVARLDTVIGPKT